ncbi:MAG: nitroreductase [Owenweeksia sp.]|nr:nitroreductase [Owenweeksia sp.]
MTDSLAQLEEIIAHRRTIKPDHYTGEKVEDRLIERLLDAANWAPTHGYTEPWRFSIYAEEGLATLGNFMANLDQPNREADSFNQKRYDRLRNRPLKCSHVIGIGMKRGHNDAVPEVEEICSVAAAVQNMWLTAHAMGLASYWSTGAMAFTDEMRDFMALSGDDRSLGFFYIGKPAIAHPKGRRISGIDEKLRWVKS